MTEATVNWTVNWKVLTRAPARGAADLALRHADLPAGGPVRVACGNLDAEALCARAWELAGPAVPSAPQPERR